ncbi:MAG: secF [Rickettsiaceae bacterium]|jgi:preprotein translocase subunit SecF|nr:secF [Rickettsiaceae bacterium]
MKLYPLRLIPDNTSIDFMKLKKISFFISAILTIASFIALFTFKLNLGIDFAGGIVIEARTSEPADLSRMRSILTDLKIGEVSLQNFGSDKDISLRIGGGATEEQLMKNIEIIKETLKKNFNLKIEYRKIDFVGPQVGEQLIKAGIQAMLLAFLAIMIYIWIRFEWQYGIGILIALAHDVIVSLGFMSITQLDFNLSSIAAILTIIGYSVNDSVVIYDRIRENFRKYHKRTIDQIINLSVNETLSRTTLTVLTTLIANLALVLFGGEAIRSFSLLVFVGIAIGTYSSIYISAPILTLFGLKRGDTK